MSAFDYLTDYAKFLVGIAIIAAFVCAGELAMKRPVERGGYWPREAADLPVRAPSQLGWPDYAAVAVVALFFAYAIAHWIGLL